MVAKKRCVGDLKEADLRGKKVLVRVDLDVPLDDNLNITDDTNFKAALPTIQYLIRHGAKVILASHIGNPQGTVLMHNNVSFVNDCIGEEVSESVAAIPDGGVLLLENLRFYKEEEKNDLDFAKKLASLADLYVNDAFRNAHIAHASTEGVTRFLSPCVAGFLMRKELHYLVGVLQSPKRPFVAIVCGSKLSSEVEVVKWKNMDFTFHRAQNLSVGASLVEEDKVGLAKSFLRKSPGFNFGIESIDFTVSDKFAPDANSKRVGMLAIPEGWMGLDIEPLVITNSINTINRKLDEAKTVVWYGSMGVFGMKKFADGAQANAKKLVEISGKGAKTINIVGDDLIADVEEVGLADKMSHISTAGDAYKAYYKARHSLEFSL
ncbi:hypothetical protein MKX03_003564 [Papaver bracteatum]|nr:hypothetical protein MKX03_003564 [Papaver bracteatum]